MEARSRRVGEHIKDIELLFAGFCDLKSLVLVPILLPLLFNLLWLVFHGLTPHRLCINETDRLSHDGDEVNWGRGQRFGGLVTRDSRLFVRVDEYVVAFSRTR